MPLIWLHQPHYLIERSGFAGTIGAKQTHYLALRYRK
jgi:hypothetical protein